MHIHVVSLQTKILYNRDRVDVLRRYSQKQVRRALLHAKASLEIEGMFLTQQEDRLLTERAEGKIRYSEFLARAKEMARNV
ncbi:hypothetical protein EDM52_21260 [Brevibacillus invocatus]|uniref:Antitoxin VbhA domain-containing protein n=1 Tax=Brevibacillus invocatus TaxID=173959 RepID=A0A3M8BXI0_9BACL|nr:hypothetical protein [Brevibacillus sp. AY1]RNB68141.1 hypothetical protein EDM52_21260 [Brevibacillus invocatus]